MSHADLFEMLGAPLRNIRWSWGAVRPDDGAVFLRVWQDEMKSIEDRPVVRVLLHAPRLKGRASPGYRERVEQIHLIRRGARSYLVMCEAVDPLAHPRDIKRVNDTEVFPGGRIFEQDGDWWIEVLPGVSVKSVRQQSR